MEFRSWDDSWGRYKQVDFGNMKLLLFLPILVLRIAAKNGDGKHLLWCLSRKLIMVAQQDGAKGKSNARFDLHHYLLLKSSSLMANAVWGSWSFSIAFSAVSKWSLYWEIMVIRFSGCTCIACLLHVMRNVLNNSGIWEAYFAVKLGRSTVQSEDAAL